MTLDNLIRELSILSARGFGDRRVIDQYGNDVAEVEKPVDDERSDARDGDDLSAVMLNCRIDYGRQR